MPCFVRDGYDCSRKKRREDNENRYGKIGAFAENMLDEIMRFGVHKWLVFQQMTQKVDKIGLKWKKNIFLACIE